MLAGVDGPDREPPPGDPTPGSAATPATPLTEPHWAADPSGEAVWRWWDGTAWTTQVSGYRHCREQLTTAPPELLAGGSSPTLDPWRGKLTLSEPPEAAGFCPGRPARRSAPVGDELYDAPVVEAALASAGRRPNRLLLLAVLTVLAVAAFPMAVILGTGFVLGTGLAVGCSMHAARAVRRWSRYSYVASTDVAGAGPGYQVLTGELHAVVSQCSPLSRTDAAWFRAGIGRMSPKGRYTECHSVTAPRVVELVSPLGGRRVLIDCDGFTISKFAPAHVHLHELPGSAGEFSSTGTITIDQHGSTLLGEAVVPEGAVVTVFGEVVETGDGRLALGGMHQWRSLCFGDAAVAERRAWGRVRTSTLCALSALLLALLALPAQRPAALFAHLAWGLGLGGLLLGALYLLGTVNGAVLLREQLRATQARIDVALAQRHELVPRLTELVRAAVRYEADVQPALAALSTPGPAVVAGVAARYPELSTAENFAQLATVLVDCEARITALRGTQADALRLAQDAAARLPAALWARPVLRAVLSPPGVTR